LPKVVDVLSRPSAIHNEDCWGRSDDAVWVMDGATGVWPVQRLSPTSDAAWFVTEMDAVLQSLTSSALDASELLAAAARSVAAKAGAICDLRGCAPAELPSASFATARRRGGRIEFANLGDCAVLWRTAGGKAQRFGSSGVARLDAALSQAFVDGVATGRAVAEVQADLMVMVRHHRTLMNTPEGYWILDMSGAGAPHTQIMTTDGPVEVLLMSDGFYRLVDVFARYDDDRLMDAARGRGVAALYAELRALEAADPDGVGFPRGKPRDDATAVLLDFA